MTIKILVDMNLSPDWTSFLSAANIEAVHWSEIGRHDAADEELLRWREANQHVLLTNDLDFGAILAATHGRSPSVVQIRADVLTPSAIGPATLRGIAQSAQALIDGALLSIDPGRARLRILPLNRCSPTPTIPSPNPTPCRSPSCRRGAP